MLALTRYHVLGLLCVAMSAAGERPAVVQPDIDHHQHLFSPAVLEMFSPDSSGAPRTPITARDLIRHLDEAGIRRAIVLSTAYILGSPARQVENEREKVRADNDWLAAQVAQFPDRLVGFCAVNPLKDYAVDEVTRCAGVAHLRRGLKLHLGHARVDYHNAAHIEQLRRVFRAANDRRMAVVVHLRPSDESIAYGRTEALIFLNEVLSGAPDIAVQIAHMAGETGNESAVGDQALSVFADAIATGDPRSRRLWFDVTQVARPTTGPERAAVIARRIRQLGIDRVLFGSDAPTPDNLPRDNWAAFRRLPLTDAEFQAISSNIPPYIQGEAANVPAIRSSSR